jgi:hypothetical protein
MSPRMVDEQGHKSWQWCEGLRAQQPYVRNDEDGTSDRCQDLLNTNAQDIDKCCTPSYYGDKSDRH